MTEVRVVACPQLNVNSESLRLASWQHAHGETVEEDAILCILEDSKASEDLHAPAAGVLCHLVAEGEQVRQGAPVALLGPSLSDCESYQKTLATTTISSPSSSAPLPGSTVRATPRARRLAEEHGVTLEEVIAAGGVTGAVKESDIERFLQSRNSGGSAPSLADTGNTGLAIPGFLEAAGELDAHARGMIRVLNRSRARAVATTIESTLDLGILLPRLRARSESKGIMLSLQHLLIKTVGETLTEFPRLANVQCEGRVYRYRSRDIAFVLSNGEGHLFTPVVRAVDALSLEEVAKECLGLGRRALAGRLSPGELTGACFTLSCLNSPAVDRFTALLNDWQSCALAVAGPQERLVLADGSVRTAPCARLVLTYDHCLIGGEEAGRFLASLPEAAERILA